MTKKVVIIGVVVVALLLMGAYIVFLTQKAQVSEQCMLGNQIACQYWQAEKNVSDAENSLKEAQEAKEKAREAYEASNTIPLLGGE